MTEPNKTIYTEEKTRELLSKYLEETGIDANLKSGIEKFLVNYRIFYRAQLDYLDKNLLIPPEIKEKIKTELEEESSMIESIITGKDPYKLARYITSVLPKLKNDLQDILSTQEFPEKLKERLHVVTSTIDRIQTSAHDELDLTNQKHQ